MPSSSGFRVFVVITRALNVLSVIHPFLTTVGRFIHWCCGEFVQPCL